MKTIIIPEKSNKNLRKGKDGMVAKSSEENDKAENDKELWDEMVKIANKKIKKYWEEYAGYDGNLKFENTGCCRDLASMSGI